MTLYERPTEQGSESEALPAKAGPPRGSLAGHTMSVHNLIDWRFNSLPVTE